MPSGEVRSVTDFADWTLQLTERANPARDAKSTASLKNSLVPELYEPIAYEAVMAAARADRLTDDDRRLGLDFVAAGKFDLRSAQVLRVVLRNNPADIAFLLCGQAMPCLEHAQRVAVAGDLSSARWRVACAHLVSMIESAPYRFQIEPGLFGASQELGRGVLDPE